MRYLFLVNPAAGKDDKKSDLISEIDSYFARYGGDYRVHLTKFRGDAESTARAEAEKGDELRIFACGGEGTCYEVINGAAGFPNVQIGVIPCGSANDFIKYFKDRRPFCDIAAQIAGESIPMDVIKAGDRYCLNGCSVGMDAMVARDMTVFKKWPFVSGSLAYKLAIVRTFLRRLGVTADITVDDKPVGRVRCLFAVVANAPYYGGGYMSAPDAVPYDGKLDFTMVDVISRIRVPKFLSLYEKGKHGGLPFCTMRNCSSMEFRSEKPVPVNLDGEIVESCGMRFELVKKAVSFVVPKGICEKILINV